MIGKEIGVNFRIPGSGGIPKHRAHSLPSLLPSFISGLRLNKGMFWLDSTKMPTLFLISICVCVYIDCRASLVAQMAKNPPAMQETQVGKIPWRREWQLTPVFLLGEPHRQRSLAAYSPWSCKELDTIEWLSLSLSCWLILLRRWHEFVWLLVNLGWIKVLYLMLITLKTCLF